MTGEADNEFVVRGPRDFGPVIRTVRDGQDIRQAALSERTGINRSRISNLENGDNNEVVRDLVRIFAELNHEIVVRPRTS